MPDVQATTSNGEPLIRTPLSTYRLQLRADFGFDKVVKLLPYLKGLGVSELYLSPLFEARAESSHGYDVVDHGVIDPAFGDFAAFKRLAISAREADLGILLDVVPNHMGINDPHNAWWNDVLENGEGGRFADYYDIDWRPAASHLAHRVLLPVLGAPFGEALESGHIKVAFDGERLNLAYFDRLFPLAPRSWPVVLDAAAERLQAWAESEPDLTEPLDELLSISTQLRHLPESTSREPNALEERYREQQIARRRLARLLASSANVADALNEAIEQINGQPDDARSFDVLEQLLDQQWYRLAFWRVATDEINYRRFFDINDLAAIRVEEPHVFDEVHRLIGEFLKRGWVTGLRIDHPDGLLDPEAYFQNLHALVRAHQPPDTEPNHKIYIAAEKILSGDEVLPPEWTISGTTGYDLLNLLNGLLVHPAGLARLRDEYVLMTGQAASPAQVIYESKRTILLNAMASELHMLATQLFRIAQKARLSRDFTLPALQRGLREFIASMSVYRTYVRPKGWEVREEDYRRITLAVRMAKRRNPTMTYAVFDFIASVALLQHPATLPVEEADERRRFVLKLQQVTGPVTAKGIEDTAFYRYFPLASLNEVGGELDFKGLSAEEFHRLMTHRVASWPLTMSATGTHDTKRGEDFRARLHVLSEIAPEWVAAVDRWQDHARPLIEEADDGPTPDRNDQYLLYQTLVGTWPADGLASFSDEGRQDYSTRITEYMRKALREAKVHTSWMTPSETYELAMDRLIDRLLNDEAAQAFRDEVDGLVQRIADAGFVNGLVQLVLKLTLPGTPDFYQGTEFWDFNLVDPDNRRPIDFDQRIERLQQLQSQARESLCETARDLAARWPSPDCKMFVTWRALEARNALAEVFVRGSYVPLAVTGPQAEHVFAFAREFENQWVAVAVPRHVQSFFSSAGTQSPDRAVLPAAWDNTSVTLPASGEWRHHFSGEAIQPQPTAAGEVAVQVSKLLRPLPVAVLSLNRQ